MKVRTGTSDVHAFCEIFVNQDYELPINIINPKVIIDGGANVGYTAVYFANRFPKAEIIAIEPENNNFIILEENISAYPNIKAIKSGIWNKNCWLKIIDAGLGEWGFMVEEIDKREPGAVEAVTIEKILEGSGHDEIDILKLDIEGAEKEVFSSNYENWLGKVKVLVVELHDRMKPGCSAAFYNAIRNYNFNKLSKGEHLILYRQKNVI